MNAQHHNHAPFAFPKQRTFMLMNSRGFSRVAYEYGPAFQINKKGEKSRQEGYTTVMIPMTPTQRRNSKKLCHFQVVRNSKLKEIKDNAFSLLKTLRS